MRLHQDGANAADGERAESRGRKKLCDGSGVRMCEDCDQRPATFLLPSVVAAGGSRFPRWCKGCAGAHSGPAEGERPARPALCRSSALVMSLKCVRGLVHQATMPSPCSQLQGQPARTAGSRQRRTGSGRSASRGGAPAAPPGTRVRTCRRTPFHMMPLHARRAGDRADTGAVHIFRDKRPCEDCGTKVRTRMTNAHTHIARWRAMGSALFCRAPVPNTHAHTCVRSQRVPQLNGSSMARARGGGCGGILRLGRSRETFAASTSSERAWS